MNNNIEKNKFLGILYDILIDEGILKYEDKPKDLKEKKNDKEFDLIEIVYPSNPSSVLLSDNSIINGVLTVDIETFMKNQNPEHLASIKENLIQSTENLEYALNALADLFVTLDEIAKQNKKNIYQSTYNLSKTTNGTQQIVNKINKSLNEKELNNSVSSFNDVAQNIDSMTTDMSKTTLPQVNNTLYQTECLLASVNEITCGIKATLAISPISCSFSTI